MSALLLGLGGSGALLPVLITFVQEWLNRRRTGSVRMKIGDDEIEITGLPDDVRQRALEEFLRRHGQ